MLRTSYSLLILVLYLDGLLIIGSSVSTIVVVKDILHDRFSMMDMGPLHYFLGIEISQDASSESSSLSLSMLGISWLDST
jgi:hypothetical protein